MVLCPLQMFSYNLDFLFYWLDKYWENWRFFKAIKKLMSGHIQATWKQRWSLLLSIDVGCAASQVGCRQPGGSWIAHEVGWLRAVILNMNYCIMCCQKMMLSKWLLKYRGLGTSLVAQWLRIRLPTQGTQVRALVREDPTCRRTTKPVRHNYWAHMPQLLKPMYLEPCSATREATAMRSPCTTTKSSPRSPQLEKARA